ncbi:MAG: molybdopterin cofactor-binding domain-containing protein [Candidatus Binataceae bacterium]
MAAAPRISRRDFIRASAAAGGGLMIAFYLPQALAAENSGKPAAKAFAPNAFIRISPDNKVTLLVGRSEMGQGVMTSLPMILADELDADWTLVHVEQAPAEPAYRNPMTGVNLTGGSTSVRGSWMELRKAGASARAMLVSAAAKKWRVKTSQCRTENSQVISGGRSLKYGELAEAAASEPLPHHVTLKKPSQFTLIGKPIARVDIPEKTNGRAVFGIDVKLPGMRQAAVAQCPVFGGKLKSFDASVTSKMKGVRGIVPISSGVAVVADHFWPALKARDALKIEWDYGKLANLDSAEITRRFAAASKHQGAIARKEGDTHGAQAYAAVKLNAIYQVPYLAHVTMEPMNCTADVRPDRCDVYAPTQAQTGAKQMAKRITGLPEDRINIITTFLGGGFGRRSEQDFVAQAVEISKAIKAPVQVIWPREEDVQHDFYRPAFYNVLNGGLDKKGNPVAWSHRIVGPSILEQMSPGRVHNGIDPTSVEGAAQIPYDIPNITVDYVLDDPGIPVGFWRSVGHSFTGYVVESFVDEMAAAAKKDPYQFRAGLLRKSPRHLRVLELAAEKAGWGKPLPKGVHRGIAVHASYGSYAAQVAEISIDSSGAIDVRRVVCAVDSGTIVNPDTIRAQMESGIVFGLSAVLMEAITLEHGRVMQANFDTFRVVRMNQTPKMEVYPIAGGGEALGGIGEPGTPPIAPAVTNAVYAATGKRIRTLPINPKDLAAS